MPWAELLSFRTRSGQTTDGGHVWYTVDCNGTSLGVVELPGGLLVAGRLQPNSAYATIADTVRRATDVFIELGLFGAAAPLAPPISPTTRARRGAMARAARLPLELMTERGARALTHFVNLLDSGDGGVIVLASFVEAPATVGALPGPTSYLGGESAPPAA